MLENVIAELRRPVTRLRGKRRTSWLLDSLNSEQSRRCADFLEGKLQPSRATPGQIILRQGSRAVSPRKPANENPAFATEVFIEDDGIYIVRGGYLKVWESTDDGERLIDHLGPGDHVGEIALLSTVSGELVLPQGSRAGIRTLNCTALDHVELVRIPGQVFLDLLDEHPDIKQLLVAEAKRRLKKNQLRREELERRARAKRKSAGQNDYIRQGLYQGQSLLMIDLNCCTRCDECTRACVESHSDGREHGVTRLERQGPLLDHYLTVTSCRSCRHAYCLEECPVDAIHREGNSPAIVFDPHCIGCGLCAHNCPYGNISMQAFDKARKRPTTCDLCGGDDGPGPRCVSACPHDAIFRCTGQELMDRANLKFE